ncbi:hypothetical protein TWF569_004208 [Orbilia oligospora]|uniref:Alpha/beta-hydrolase n=1 Tax=Orbilia oligospora TaxID=2813651 RepID=A0A7C8J5B8_ORBOL|nr:hypothetical protein TWF706_002835 [Orbilia oligospora]KAF3086766.1 hypothetical protein TWF102_010950 [Orbilia oligospora]KAF3095801.1 hypothetical protein TWF103_010029 [Orbilia oligospora]KAF3138367.1 hypothetical protein TWF594_007193 [Orbilia oligospora]KAF3139131.1 hypothetical protein TWF703_004071 [Orbilia oligospora]
MSLSSYLKQKAASALTPTATPTAAPTTAAPANTAPAAAAPTAPVPDTAPSSRFGLSMPSMPSLKSATSGALSTIGGGIIPTGIDSTDNNNNGAFPPIGGIHPRVTSPNHPRLPVVRHPSGFIPPETPDYSISEDKLKAAIQLDKDWDKYIDLNPVLLVPGTGSYGGSCYHHNFAKLLRNASPRFATFAWVNVPGAMCDESPKNAEYIAYAIHWLWLRTYRGYSEADINKHQITVIGWSQGNLSIQWALKYWPHTRNLIKNFVAISADFHGTLLAPPITAAPAILHQWYWSKFIRTLRANGGDSAYVPTTSIYSSFYDEVVQPQIGDLASAYMKDERGVGVLNFDLQQRCPLTPAGVLHGHSGVLYNNVAWALTKDAIINGGTASIEPGRVDLPTESMQLWAPGLNPFDIAATIALIPVAGINMLKFFPIALVEPALPPYAAKESEALGPPPALTPEQQAIVDANKNKPLFPSKPAVDPSVASVLPK